MAYSTITKPSLYFNTKIYTGNASTPTNITGVGFQPDWVWIKNRSATEMHILADAVRGANKLLESNTTDAELSDTNYIKAFQSDGFQIGSEGAVNGNGNSMVSWNWKANGAGSANTDGSINSTVSVNTTAGFSIVQWSGNSTAGASVGHGLSVAPDLIIKKRIDSSSGYWYTYSKALGNNKSIYLNTNNAQATSGAWNNQTPTNTVFYNGSSNVENGGTMISYCFKSIKGYSKIGTYTGNGNADGTFVYTGFKPAFIMAKTSSHAGNWFMWDNKRPNEFNLVDSFLEADGSVVEYTSNANHSIDILSNGFKMRGASGTNNSGRVNIYMAFAEEPLVANVGQGIPATAR